MDIKKLARITDSSEENEVKWEDIKLHGEYLEKIEGVDGETLPVKVVAKDDKVIIVYDLELGVKLSKEKSEILDKKKDTKYFLEASYYDDEEFDEEDANAIDGSTYVLERSGEDIKTIYGDTVKFYKK